MWFYKNTGTNQLPQFTFQKTSFLQDQMIEQAQAKMPYFGAGSSGFGDGLGNLVDGPFLHHGHLKNQEKGKSNATKIHLTAAPG